MNAVTPRSTKQEQAAAPRLFVSSAPEDRPFLTALLKHLAGMTSASLISTWSMLDLAPGEDTERRIREELDRADLALILLSADYISSEHCLDAQLGYALRRGLRIIPVIVRPVELRGTGLASIATLPLDGPPVSEWPSQDAAWAHVLAHLYSLVATGEHGPAGSLHQRPSEATVPTIEPSPPSSRRNRSFALPAGKGEIQVNLRVAATFSAAGAVAGFTLEVTQASTLLFVVVLVALATLLLAWALKSLLAASAPAKAAAGPISAAKAYAGTTLATGSLAGSWTTSASTVATLLSSAALTTGTTVATAELTATISGHPARWAEVVGIHADEDAIAPEVRLMIIHVAPDVPPAPTATVSSSSLPMPQPTDSAPTTLSTPRATTVTHPLRVARVDFSGDYEYAVLRSGPSRSARKLLSVPRGSEVTLLGQSRPDEAHDAGIWYHARFAGTVGWLHANTLEGE